MGGECFHRVSRSLVDSERARVVCVESVGERETSPPPALPPQLLVDAWLELERPLLQLPHRHVHAEIG